MLLSIMLHRTRRASWSYGHGYRILIGACIRMVCLIHVFQWAEEEALRNMPPPEVKELLGYFWLGLEFGRFPPRSIHDDANHTLRYARFAALALLPCSRCVIAMLWPHFACRPDGFESDCKAKQICFMAFLPPLEQAGKADREHFIKSLQDSAERFKRNPFGWTWSAATSQGAAEKVS